MTNNKEPWASAAQEIRSSLATGLDVAGTVEEADVFTRIGATCLEVVIEATDAEGDEQIDAYRVLCDLLDTRLAAGKADQIIGCLLIAGRPSANALAPGLAHMTRSSGAFVPVLPLGQDQAVALAESPVALADFADDAIALLKAACTERPATASVAQALLDDLDALVTNACVSSPAVLASGLIETLGVGTCEAAVDRLVAAIGSNDKLRLSAQINHSAGAASVGLDLAPTVEVMFGNPALGTPLMHISPTVAIDLPQKILIIETDAGVRVLHNDPAYLAARHGISPDTAQLAVIAKALSNLANIAAGIDQ